MTIKESYLRKIFTLTCLGNFRRFDRVKLVKKILDFILIRIEVN